MGLVVRDMATFHRWHWLRLLTWIAVGLVAVGYSQCELSATISNADEVPRSLCGWPLVHHEGTTWLPGTPPYTIQHAPPAKGILLVPLAVNVSVCLAMLACTAFCCERFRGRMNMQVRLVTLIQGVSTVCLVMAFLRVEAEYFGRTRKTMDDEIEWFMALLNGERFAFPSIIERYPPLAAVSLLVAVACTSITLTCIVHRVGSAIVSRMRLAGPAVE